MLTLLSELVRLQPKVIVASGSPAAIAARNVTATPIVFTFATDPVGLGDAMTCRLSGQSGPSRRADKFMSSRPSLGGLDVSIAEMQFERCTGGMPVPGGLPVGAASPGRSPGGLCLGLQRVLRLVEIALRRRGANDWGSTLPLECDPRFLKNIAAPEEQHEGQERADRNHRIGDDTE
jgi:hypothetical protein